MQILDRADLRQLSVMNLLSSDDHDKQTMITSSSFQQINKYYLFRYLVNQVLSESDRQKTFVLSSFFYGRLMRREYGRDKSSRDATLSRMEKRHQKVCTWTRNVDIFQKDFIIIPINEQ